MVIKSRPPPLTPSASPDRFRIQRHFRLFKSTEPILFTRGAETGRQEDRRKRDRKREKTNKFAANRPLKTRHANGSRGNFKFYDSKSRRCDIPPASTARRCYFLPGATATSARRPFSPVSPFLHRRVVFTPPSVLLKSSRFRKSLPARRPRGFPTRPLNYYI